MSETYVVVAGGPSVTLSAVRLIGRARASEVCRVIAVNDAVYPCWFADHLHACDTAWWLANDGVPGFAGKKTSLQATPYADVELLNNSGIDGYDPTIGNLRNGGNSGYQAIHYAVQMGAKKVILLGVDYSDNGARKHWFGLHDGAMDKISNVEEWRLKLIDLTAILFDMHIELVNAGEKSSLTWLRKCDLKKELFG